jgi:hypothetical protein
MVNLLARSQTVGEFPSILLLDSGGSCGSTCRLRWIIYSTMQFSRATPLEWVVACASPQEAQVQLAQHPSTYSPGDSVRSLTEGAGAHPYAEIREGLVSPGFAA